MKIPYYKYRPLYIQKDDGSRIPHPFTESIFTKAEIYYGAPKDFNDPFDCNLKLNVDNSTDTEWEAYIDDLITDYPTQKGALTVVKNNKSWNSLPSLANIGTEQRESHYVKSSVFCLAMKYNSIPMYSYYADSHTGIAIELAFTDKEIPCGFNYNSPGPNGRPYEEKIVFGEVKYPTIFPELNYHKLRGREDLVHNLIFTKSHEWAHEREFRIFRRNVAKSSITFDRTLITKVIFGCKTSNADVDLVRGWLTNWPADVILSRAEPATNRFELVIKDFDLVKGR